MLHTPWHGEKHVWHGLFAHANRPEADCIENNLPSTVAWRIGGRSSLEGSIFIAGAVTSGWDGLGFFKNAKEIENPPPV